MKLLDVEGVKALIPVQNTKAYAIIRQLNEELQSKEVHDHPGARAREIPDGALLPGGRYPMIRCYNFEVYTESLDGIIRYRKSSHQRRACRADGKGRAAKKGWKITGTVHQFKLEEIGNGK